MTIREAIDQADALRPNAVEEQEKRLWLAQLDGAMRRQIHHQHEADTDTADCGADLSQGDDTVLLAQEPYTGIYTYWLMAQIDLALGEVGRYNNDMMLYNMALTEYAVDYKRNHTPLERGQFML